MITIIAVRGKERKKGNKQSTKDAKTDVLQKALDFGQNGIYVVQALENLRKVKTMKQLSENGQKIWDTIQPALHPIMRSVLEKDGALNYILTEAFWLPVQMALLNGCEDTWTFATYYNMPREDAENMLWQAYRAIMNARKTIIKQS